MRDTLDLATIILTSNEELHIRRCLENVRQFSRQIFVIDCFSTDKTVEIAQELGATVLQHKWENSYAKQFNWALDNCPVSAAWILRLDADEYLFPEAIEELRRTLPKLPDDVTSMEMPLARIWMGRRIHHGTGTIMLKRLFRYGIGRCESRLMDEHITSLRGRSISMKNGFADHNLNDLSWWAQKHINYAIREAADLLDIEFDLLGNAAGDAQKNIGAQAASKRKTKYRYAGLPLFWRAFAYFLYRYFLRLGFLEGKEGFCWHFFQGLWYRMLVDAKVLEIKRACSKDPQAIRDYLEAHYHITLK